MNIFVFLACIIQHNIIPEILNCNYINVSGRWPNNLWLNGKSRYISIAILLTYSFILEVIHYHIVCNKDHIAHCFRLCSHHCKYRCNSQYLRTTSQSLNAIKYGFSVLFCPAFLFCCYRYTARQSTPTKPEQSPIKWYAGNKLKIPLISLNTLSWNVL